MHLTSLLAACVIALATGLTSTNARAQAASESASDVAEQARVQLEVAERAFNEKRYRDAITAYLAADRLQPNPALQLALGKTYEQLNDPSRALASYREYSNRAPRGADRTHIQARVAELARRLAETGVQQVSVSSEPPGASVVVDQKPIGVTPIYVDLPPGSHHLEFHHKGYRPAALDFELSPQQPLNVMTTLVALPPGSAPAPVAAAPATATPGATENIPSPETAPAVSAATDMPPGEVRASHSSTLLRTIGFAAIGTSIAALGGAVTLELMRSHSESRARQQDEQIAFKKTLDRMESQQTAARAFAIAAGVLAVAGGVLLVVAIDDAEEEPSSGIVGLACLPVGCQATVQGRF